MNYLNKKTLYKDMDNVPLEKSNILKLLKDQGLEIGEKSEIKLRH